MTVGMALERLQSLRPHEYPETELRAWLWEVEQMIFHEIIRPRSGQVNPPEPIDDRTPSDRQLLAQDPYGQLYLFYLMTQIDLHRAESERYAFDGAMFHQAYLQFAHAFAREHLPESAGVVKV